jgi:hypothetical protein
MVNLSRMLGAKEEESLFGYREVGFKKLFENSLL